MRAIVVSNIESRRTAYFIKAGENLNIDIRFITYDELEKNLPLYSDMLIKLEPPSYDVADFLEYSHLCDDYIHLLKRINKANKAEDIYFLNNPEAILLTIDKVESKHRLSDLQTTPLLSSSVVDFDELMELIRQRNKNKVFIKPRYGSGAGGIMALRLNTKSGDMRAYTTLAKINNRFCNTKQIHSLHNPKEISSLANTIFKVGALVEEWIIKDNRKGENYDLRIVSQFGRCEYVVVRYSKGTITNLHLNNKAGDFNELNIPHTLQEEIYKQCIKANELLGLNYSGTDILIEKDTRKPYIIEVNGQGDHIYRDMFNLNTIYKNQIKHFNGSRC